MTAPIGEWDGPAIRPGCAWWTRLDDRYLVEVQYEPNMPILLRPDGLGDYAGVLCVFDREQDMKLIHEEHTTILEGARFGPDVYDVERWQEAVLRVIDG